MFLNIFYANVCFISVAQMDKAWYNIERSGSRSRSSARSRSRSRKTLFEKSLAKTFHIKDIIICHNYKNILAFCNIGKSSVKQKTF